MTGSHPCVRAGLLALLGIPVALAFLRWTRPLFLPIVVAVLLHFMLEPLVRLLRRARVPPSVSAAVLLLLLSGSAGCAGYLVFDPALDWARSLPVKLQRAEYRLRALKAPVQEVTRASEQVEDIATIPSRDNEQVVRVGKPSLAEAIISGIGDLAAGSLIGLVLVYFLLSHGDSIREKVAAAFPSSAVVHPRTSSIRTIQSRIAKYLVTITAINACLGIAVGALLFAVGMPNPVLWGLMACVLNFVPYLGSMIGVAIVVLVGLVTFDPLAPTLIAASGYAALTILEGLVLTPMVLGYRFAVSPVIVFLWLLLWNWLWGIPGALIAVPLLVAVKIVCDGSSSLEPLRVWLE